MNTTLIFQLKYPQDNPSTTQLHSPPVNSTKSSTVTMGLKLIQNAMHAAVPSRFCRYIEAIATFAEVVVFLFSVFLMHWLLSVTKRAQILDATSTDSLSSNVASSRTAETLPGDTEHTIAPVPESEQTIFGSPGSRASARFLTLPLELREHIYTLSMCGLPPRIDVLGFHTLEPHVFFPNILPGICFVSKSIYEEALIAWIRRTRFMIHGLLQHDKLQR